MIDKPPKPPIVIARDLEEFRIEDTPAEVIEALEKELRLTPADVLDALETSHTAPSLEWRAAETTSCPGCLARRAELDPP
jgi:hypothetical protein